MKKNVMMRLASFLLVAVLISTSAISGTYAKYTTQDSGADGARVAKWGVELQVFGNLYGDTYKDLIEADVTDNTEGTKIRVQSVDKAADVVAPGTKNAEGFKISMKGKPEVDGIITTEIKTQNIFLKTGEYGVMVKVAPGTITADNYDEVKSDELYELADGKYVKSDDYAEGDEFYTLEDYVDLEMDYYPVIYNLAGNTSSVSNHKTDSLAAAALKIAGKVGAVAATPDADHVTTYTGTTPFNTNTDLATEFKLDNLVLTWEWKFDTDNCGKEGNDAGMLCKADTILGNLQDGTLNVVRMDSGKYVPVDGKYYCLNTQFSIDITVTQVD